MTSTEGGGGGLRKSRRGYRYTGHSDTPLTVTVLVNPMLPNSVVVSKCLLTVTLFLCPEDVTVTENVCTETLHDCVSDKGKEGGGYLRRHMYKPPRGILSPSRLATSHPLAMRIRFLVPSHLLRNDGLVPQSIMSFHDAENRTAKVADFDFSPVTVFREAFCRSRLLDSNVLNSDMQYISSLYSYLRQILYHI